MTLNRCLWMLSSLLTAMPLWGQNAISLGCPSQAAAGSGVSCPVSLSLGAGVTLDSLTFGVSVTPNGSAPALTAGQLSFSDSIGGAFKNTGGTNNAIGVMWSGLSPALSGSLAAGSVGFSLPAAAITGQTYSVVITGPSASLGDTVVSLSTGATNTVTIPALPSQNITFGALGDVSFGASPFSVSATASSGLAVSFASTTTSVCTVSGSSVTIAAGGACSITASQAGNASYAAATPVTRSFTVNPASQTINFGALSNVTLGVSPFAIGAAASSSLAVSFASTTVSVCTVSGSTVTIAAGGACSITATQAGNVNYAAATPVTQGFTVNAASQTIAFGALNGVTYGVAAFPIGATASSGLAVSFASNTASVCTVSGSTVTIVAGGACSITATQAGNANYAAATPVIQSFTVSPASQTIAFGALNGVVYGVSPFTIGATASSGLAVSLASATTPVCTVFGSTVTIVAGGACSITASQAGDATYGAATPVTQGFTVNPASQTITFGALSGVTYGVSPFTIGATASSGLAVSLASATTPVCTVSGSTVTVVAGGLCSITASQSGSASYGAATPVPQSFAVNPAAQSIAFGALSNVALGVTPFPVAATASSALAVSLASTTMPVCTVSGSTVTVVAVGACSITASQAGNASYAAAPPVTRSFTVNPASQTIDFGALSNVNLGVSPFTIGATASSGLAVSLASTTTSVCTVSGSTVTIVAGGACAITASQAGNATYGAATPVTQGFTVNPASQTITFGALGGVGFGVPPFAITATASSGLTVSFASTTASVCTASGGTVTIVALGACSILASQAGNASYAAAAPVTRSFTVAPGSQSIAFGPLGSVSLDAGPFPVAATASSGLTVSFASTTPAVCSVAGNMVTVVTLGACSITASQAGNADYAAAASVTRNFTIGQGSQSITFAPLNDIGLNAGPVSLAATASSGLAVSFASTTPAVCTVSGGIVTIAAPGACSITASQAGNANYSAAAPVTRSFAVNQGLSIITVALPNGAQGETYGQTLTAANGSGALSWALAAGSLPGGISLSASGALSGTPANSGFFAFTAKVADGAGNTAVQALSLQVNAPLLVTTAVLPNGVRGAAYSQTLTAAGGAGVCAWTVSAGNLPAGIALSGAVLSGTPTAAGAFAFTVRVADNAGGTASQTFSLQVGAPLSIATSATLPNAVTGQPYAVPFLAAGGAGGPYTWSLFSGALPAGLALSPAGVLSGNPSSPGNSSFLVSVSDGVSPPAGLTASLSVYGALFITTEFLPNGKVNLAYGPVILAATGGSGSVAWSAAGLPAGISISAGGALSGASPAAGTFAVAIVAVDPVSGQTRNASLPLTVAAPTSALAIGPSNLALGAGLGVSIAGAFTPSGGTPPYTWSIAGGALPAGVALGSGGSIGGSASQAGNYAATVRITDAQAASATAQIMIDILGLTPAALPAGAATVPYSAVFTGVGGAPPYVFSATGLPAGFSLSGGGALSGVAPSPGGFSFQVQASDSAGVSASAAYSLTMGQAPVSIPAPALADGTAGAPYSQTLGATGGNPPYTWSMVAGFVPTGLSLAPSGTIFGNPSVPGAYTFPVVATDASGGIAYATAAILIHPAPLAVTTAGLPSGVMGFEYPPQILGASGGARPYTFAITSGGLPSGLSLTAGVLGGTSRSVGNFPITVTATDSAGAQAGASLSIDVRPPGCDLVLLSGSLSFSLVTGATATPPAQTVGVQSSMASQAVGYTVAVSPAAAWLSVTGGGATPGWLSVTLTSQALTLPPGSSETRIALTCTSPVCMGKTQSVAVFLNVSSPPPALSVANGLLSFTSTSTPPRAQTQELGIRNSGGGALAVGSIACQSPWCTVGAYPASLAGGPGAQVDVSADPTQLNTGFYRTAVDIVTSAGNVSVPVTLFLSPIGGMTLTPSDAQFQMQTGGAPGNPNGAFRIGVVGGAVNWTASVLPGANWLTLTSSSGTASDSEAGNVSFAIQSSAASLAAQAYYGVIEVSASGVVNSPQDFRVVLNVTPPTTSAKPDPQPAGLLFLTTAGGSPAPQTVTVYSDSPVPAGYQAAASTETGAWLSASPQAGMTSASSPDRSTVTVSAAGMAQGVYRGGVSYAMSGAGVRTVHVTLIVQPNGMGADGLSASPRLSAGCVASALVPVSTGLAGNFSVAASWPAPLTIVLMDDCGAAVAGAQVTASFSTGDPPLRLWPVSGAAGLYSAIWRPWQSAAQASISVRATAPGLAEATAQITGSVMPNSVPAVAANGVLLPFDSQIGPALAPGAVVSIYGSNLAGVAAQAGSVPLPTSMNGVGVRIGGLAAPLFYVSSGQINAQIGFELDALKQYQVVVNSNGAVSAPQTIQLTAATPALAAFPDGGVIAQHWADSSLITAASPARPGEYIVLYLVGMGPTDYPVATGAASPVNPLARVISAPVVTLGGNPVQTLFAGLTPGSVGLYQIDLQVPNVPVDGNLILTVSQGGAVGNATILPVRH